MRKLDDGVFLYPGSPSTLIVLSQDGAVLVDPGRGKGRHKDLRRELRKLDVSLRAQLLTHAHSDHVEVCNKLEAPVYAHRFEFSIAESPVVRELTTFGSRVFGQSDYLLRDEVRVHGIFEWDDEPFGLRAVKLNGHSPGMTGFLTGNVLYAGDSLFGDRLIKAVGIPYFVDYKTFTDSLRTVRGFAEEGYTIVPSHGPVVRDEKALELVEFNLRRLEELKELTLKLLERPVRVDELTYRLMGGYGVEVTPQALMLNEVPVEALLAYLCDEGLVGVRVDEGLRFGRKVFKGTYR